MGDRRRASKALSWLLRHGASEQGVALDAAGWARLDHVLALRQFNKLTVKDVEDIVRDCPKQRFSLKQQDEQYFIKANQGHTLQVEEGELEELRGDPGHPVIHGTYHRFWDTIRAQGLSRQARLHIHFAAGLTGASQVISGLRNSAEIYIYVDVEKAITSGYKFFRSANNVILCPGNEDGFLPTEFFLKVVDKKTGKNLTSE